MDQRQRLAEDLLLLRERASQYALYGVYIARASVVIATLLVCHVMIDDITIDGIILAQTSNIALWTVDSMPFLFAMWGNMRVSAWRARPTISFSTRRNLCARR